MWIEFNSVTSKLICSSTPNSGSNSITMDLREFDSRLLAGFNPITKLVDLFVCLNFKPPAYGSGLLLRVSHQGCKVIIIGRHAKMDPWLILLAQLMTSRRLSFWHRWPHRLQMSPRSWQLSSLASFCSSLLHPGPRK